MNKRILHWILSCGAVLLFVFVTGHDAVADDCCLAETNVVSRVRSLSPEFKNKVLALDPERVTERDVSQLLFQTPAPRIVNIHGGIFPIKSGMNSFAELLIGLGYPESSLRHPEDGSYTYGYYEDGEKLAGILAWYYENEGLRPMLVGHSQGGIQVIRVLHILAGDSGTNLFVWNPVTDKREDRYEIKDPWNGLDQPVVGLQLSFATAAQSGGLARTFPNAWNMNSKLRKIPDSVEDFIGFQKGLDPLGGDFFGYGKSNDYLALGDAHVRNVRLPAIGSHWTLPYVKKLLKDDRVMDWIRRYQPAEHVDYAALPDSGRRGAQILWAAEVWHSVKKHWVLELQRAIHERS